MKTLKFWTKNETSRMLELVKTSRNKLEAFKTLSKEIGRKPANISAKYYSIPKGEIKPKKQEITLPQGFTFDFVPKKAVMEKNRVILYF